MNYFFCGNGNIKFCSAMWWVFISWVSVSVLSGVLLFLPPWRVYATDRYRILCVLVLVIVAVLSLIWHGVRSRVDFNLGKNSILWGCCFITAGFISSLESPFPRYALQEWGYFSGSLLLGLGVYQFVLNNKIVALRDLSQAVFFAVYTYSLFYLVWYFTRENCAQMFCVQLQLPLFDNPRIFDSLYIPLLLLYPLSLAGMPNRVLIKISYWFLGAVWFSLLLVSNSRTNYLVIMMVCVLAYWVAPRLALPWLKRLALLLFFGGMCYLALHAGWPLLSGASFEVSPMTSVFATNSIDSRIELWHRALIMFMAHPLLGVGPVHFAFYGDIPHLAEGAGPHNLTLQLLAEWGLVGALLFYAGAFALLGKAVVYFRRNRDLLAVDEGAAGLALLLAWAAILLAAQTSGTNMLMLAGYGGVLAGVVCPCYAKNTGRLGNGMRWGLIVLSAVVAGVLLNGLYPEITCRMEEAAAYSKKYNGEIPSPRLWSQGKIPFAAEYLPQCYKDAQRPFADWAGFSHSQQKE